MQQVAAQGFADAQLVDPRRLPVPLNSLARRSRLNLAHAWVLHKRSIVRATAAGVVLAAAVGAYEARDGLVASGFAAANLAQGQLAHVGLGISQINIAGQSITSEAAILKALAVGPNVSILNFDADGALARMKAIPSIKSATVRKVYPGALSVAVEEKVPMARWRIGDASYLVDESGSPVARDDGSFRELPLVVGEGAADDAMVMIHALERHPAIKQDLAALSRIGERRWDLIFYSGLRVQLPENGVAQALQQLDDYQRDHQLLDRDVSVIDMRVAGMVSLRLGDLAAKARADAAKQTKHVTTGDAEYETAAERAAGSKTQ